MIIVGLTGGIGSGKTTVAKMFESFGIPIYIADEEAKKLMHSSEELKEELIDLLGKDAYNDKGLNRSYIADKIFNDAELLKKMNKIVHPAVGKHFKKWAGTKQAPYVIKEAAILFENGGYKECDFTILVTAPLEMRIERLLRRDDTSKKKIEDRMKNQWPDEKKRKLANFIIENIDLKATEVAVKEVHETLVNRRKVE